jgi:hypothetical protein
MSQDTRPLIERQADAWMSRAATAGHIAERVNREPCFRCGARADVGCRHVRWSNEAKQEAA